MRRDEVKYAVEIAPEDIPPEGNAIASGDAAVGAEYIANIRRRLENGDLWAWCCVKVSARWGGFEGVDYLGACCYEDEASFMQDGGYYQDMKERALEDLESQLQSAKEYFT